MLLRRCWYGDHIYYKRVFIKDQKAFEHMKRDLDKEVPVHKMVAESVSLKKSKEKLATFVFR